MQESKPRLRYPVIVEGKYDQIKLSSLFEGEIFTTGGFGVFRDEEKRELFRRAAKRTPLIVFTDSDGAGMLIRNHLKGVLPPDRLIQLYIPQVPGKEKRKSTPSKEGFLGVEGSDAALLRRLFAPYLDEAKERTLCPALSRTTLYEKGYIGATNSAQKRKELEARCGLPQNLSVSALIDVLQLLYSREEIDALL